MIRFITTLIFLVALAIAGDAQACSTDADTVEGSAAKAVQYAETVVNWHQIRKVSAAKPQDSQFSRVNNKHAEASGQLTAARALLKSGDYEGAMKRAYRVPEILHYQ